MPRADRATIDLLTDYFNAMEVKDFDRLGAYYADDITQTFANAPTITGRDTMLARMVDLLGKVESLAHPLINVWQEDDGVVIFEVASIWRFHDDTEVKDQRLLDLHDRRREVHRPTHLRRQRPHRPLPRLDNTTTPTRQKARSCPAFSSRTPPRGSAATHRPPTHRGGYSEFVTHEPDNSRSRNRQYRLELDGLYINRFWSVDDELTMADPASEPERYKRLHIRYLKLCEDEFDAARLGWLDPQQWAVWHAEYLRASLRAELESAIRDHGDALDLRSLKVCLAQTASVGPHDAQTCSALAIRLS